MGVSINTRQAYSEVDEFLDLIGKDYINKLPPKLRAFFKEEKDKSYIKGLKSDVPIKEQGLKDETLAIIALLNLRYWCKDESEKKRLKEIYNQNEKNYQKYIQDSVKKNQTFNSNINMNVEYKETKEENVAIINYNNNIIRKLINNIIKKLKQYKKQ